MKRIIIVSLFVMAACAPAPTPAVQTVEVEVTRLAEVTRQVIQTVEVTRAVVSEVTRIVEIPVTVTPTQTPLYTPTITPTPTNTARPTDTQVPTPTPNIAKTATAIALSKLRASRSDGFYLVNVDIAPGVWRSEVAGLDSCYWATTRSNGDIIRNHFGQSGGTAYIGPNDFQVQFKGCGRWKWISEP